MSFHGKTFEDEFKELSNCSSNDKLSNSKISYWSLPKNSRTIIRTSSDDINLKSPHEAKPNTRDSNEAEVRNESLPEVIGWRRAVMDDKPAIKQLQKLTGDIADSLYRKRSIDELIEKSSFPIVQLDSKNKLISFTACDSCPNIPSVPSFFWNNWLTENYRLKNVSTQNALFVHYMVWQPQQAKRFLRLLLQTSFTEFIHLQHIILIKPPKTNVPDFYGEYFFPILPSGLEKLDYNSVQSLLVCLRSSIIRPMHIRIAFEDEFYTVTSVIYKNMKDSDKFSVQDILNFMYKQGRKTLISEMDGKLAGVMILDLKINLELLNEGFELVPFHGLRKRDIKDEEEYDLESLSMPKISSYRIHEHPNFLISSEFLFSHMNWEMMLNKVKNTELSVRTDDSSSSDSDSFQFPFTGMSSLVDINSTESSAEQKFVNSVQGKNELVHKIISDVQVSIHTSISNLPRFCVPRYHGNANAFMINFFAIDCSKVDKRLSMFDFLTAAFKIVPDREYCLLIIPTDLIPFPLLDLFVRVTPKFKSNLKQELYLCHKNSLSIMSMTVRSAKREDLVNVYNFLKFVECSEIIYQDFLNKCFDERENFLSFVLIVKEEVVGISVIDLRDYVKCIHLDFDVADYIPNEPKKITQSVVKHLILNPIYRNHTGFFIRDIMRLADLTHLYYVYSEPREGQCSILTALSEFVPIKPKRKIGLNDNFSMAQPPESKKCINQCSLYFINNKLCELVKIPVNIVVVVVGASRTALSFFESLIYGPKNVYISYNNLICVTPHGLESISADIELKDLMFAHKDGFSRKYISMLSFKTFVTFIYGIMTEINRSEKYIVVNNKTIFKYDYLILTCGLQYPSPTPKAKEDTRKNCRGDNRSSLARFLNASESQKIYFPKHPSNMFVINTTSDAKNALTSLQHLMHKLKNINQANRKIIIYGHDLNVLLTIHTLLKFGIPGDFIVFVEPFPSETTSVTLFNDYYVDQAVLESVKSNKVSYYTEYFLYDWSVNSDDYITSITFHSKRKQITIPCLAFFPFEKKSVSDVTFNACNNCGLVYDGRLVINHNFKTNDDYIYAAGPFTKYARRYYATEKDHQFYSSTEVGQKLAEIIRWKIDPTLKDESEEESDLVPEMTAPLLLHCQLPGGFNYFVLRNPGKELDRETAYNFFNYGEVLITGDSQMKNNQGYFRLHLSPEGFVESITCYTKDNIDFVNLASLYGLHERLLNNLVFRYDLSLVPNLFDYFRQPWALALYHEDFQLLREWNYKAFYRKLSSDSDESFIEKVVNKLVMNKWNALSHKERQQLESEYQSSDIVREIKYNLIEFLTCHQEDLPVYALPTNMEFLFSETT